MFWAENRQMECKTFLSALNAPAAGEKQGKFWIIRRLYAILARIREGWYALTKMEGIGNDYIYINGLEETVADPAALSVRMSRLHFGCGSDGLIMILPSDKADFRMQMFNNDGSESEMCGNGIRRVAKYCHDRGLTDKTDLTIETGAGVKQLHPNVEKTARRSACGWIWACRS